MTKTHYYLDPTYAGGKALIRSIEKELGENRLGEAATICRVLQNISSGDSIGLILVGSQSVEELKDLADGKVEDFVGLDLIALVQDDQDQLVQMVEQLHPRMIYRHFTKPEAILFSIKSLASRVESRIHKWYMNSDQVV